MKSQADVERRLEKLRKRYRLKFVQERAGRRHANCVYNHEQSPNPLKYSRTVEEVLPPRSMAPRKQTTLLVVQPERPVRICMYGVNTDEWNGDVCDTDEKALGCPWFKPSRTEDEAAAEFDSLMEDVEYVFENYRDMATLQWVLNIRSPADIPDAPPTPSTPPTLWERFLRWWRAEKPVPQLPPPEPEEPVTEPNPDLPKDLWDADTKGP